MTIGHAGKTNNTRAVFGSAVLAAFGSLFAFSCGSEPAALLPTSADVASDGGVSLDAADTGSRFACTLGREDTVSACTDGCSNDSDGFIDCDDYDCCNVVTCPNTSACGRRTVPADAGTRTTMEATAEKCGNRMDDDGDGRVDGSDFGCCQIVSPSTCPLRCEATPLSLVPNAEKTIAEATFTATFSNSKPSMWTFDVENRLTYSSWAPGSEGQPGYRSRAREFGVTFDLPAVGVNAGNAQLQVTVRAAAAATWTATIVDSTFAKAECKVGSAAFAVSGVQPNTTQSLIFNQPRFPYPPVFQAGSRLTLLITQVAANQASVDAMPSRADVRVQYTR
jgi:hypothetical protein